MNLSYRQSIKNTVRHKILKRAVELLTTDRSSACCVRSSYVRDAYDYFREMDESHEQTEALKIDPEYIREWERLHSDNLGHKRPSELSVCYLSGPEPENDFRELIALGILPQNIWAFECEQQTYLQALQSIDSTDYRQPKLLKTSIERFFESSPKKFDIVYIDACSPIVSDQHALRCIASMFKYQRLNSPGILISNFAEVDSSNPVLLGECTDMIARYVFAKKYRNAALISDGEKMRYKEGFTVQKEDVCNHFDRYYGNFVTSMICNAGSIIVPTLRFANSNYMQSIATPPPPNYSFSFADINTIKNNTLYKYFATNAFLQGKQSDFIGIGRTDKLLRELSPGNERVDYIAASKRISEIKHSDTDIHRSIIDAVRFFDDKSNMYQFLDAPNRVLFFDSAINQLAYPMHYCTDSCLRLTYKAKQTRMFTDLIVFDECRYVYDWLPAIHQIPNAFKNPSWQYTYRFALDGLIKQRMNYNNEFFFQGSVIQKNSDGFEAKLFPDRIAIN